MTAGDGETNAEPPATEPAADGRLYREDGTAYAPWLSDLPKPSAKKKRPSATGKLASDPQLAELSGVGVTWRMLGDEGELCWNTGSEEGNLGFVVSRRRGRDGEWAQVADYKSAPAELSSKGPDGGAYSFLVRDLEEGSWVYRISDVDAAGNVSDLSQTLVEVESVEDSKGRIVALGVLVGVMLLALFAGLSLDPLSST